MMPIKASLARLCRQPIDDGWNGLHREGSIYCRGMMSQGSGEGSAWREWENEPLRWGYACYRVAAKRPADRHQERTVEGSAIGD